MNVYNILSACLCTSVNITMLSLVNIYYLRERKKEREGKREGKRERKRKGGREGILVLCTIAVLENVVCSCRKKPAKFL